MSLNLTIIGTSTLSLIIISALAGTFYFYSESSWITASPAFRFDLLFSFQFGIAITLCLVLIFTENSSMPHGYVSRPLQVNRFLSLLISLCFLYSVQQVVSIVMFGVGYGRKEPLKDRWVVYSLLCLLTLVTTGTSAGMVCLLYTSNELDFTEICVRKKDYDEKSVRVRLKRVLQNIVDDPLQVAREFSDCFPIFRMALYPRAQRKLAMFFIKRYFTYPRLTAAQDLEGFDIENDGRCFCCHESLEPDEGYARLLHGIVIRRAHWYCLERWQIYPGTGRCEISDAVSELRNMGGVVTIEERDLLVQALAE